MVKLGFIVEGETEKIVLEKSDFFGYLKSLSIDYYPKVIDAKGIDKLLPHRISEYTQLLTENGVNKIVILADLDADACITITKQRINPSDKHILVISVKEIEAWFLSDTSAMRTFLNDPEYYCYSPESIDDPFTEIKSNRLSRVGRGVDDKLILADILIKRNNFSILKAAQHPNCNSAKYFLNKISQFSQIA